MNKIKNLLLWCKYHTDGYTNVHLTNFTTSWKNGLAFCALIHRFKPDLINYHELDPENEYYNNYTAFKIAESHLGIPALLDAKDMMKCQERLSIITYVSQFYNCLKEMEPEGGPDINKFGVNEQMESDFERVSARASVCRLTRLKCCICGNKVFLLERYIAADKLYHRKCYRKIQLETLDESDSDSVIGDYLNIYGELKMNMNKNIFVHPLAGNSTSAVARFESQRGNEIGTELETPGEPESVTELELPGEHELTAEIESDKHDEMLNIKNLVLNSPVRLSREEFEDESVDSTLSVLSSGYSQYSDFIESDSPTAQTTESVLDEVETEIKVDTKSEQEREADTEPESDRDIPLSQENIVLNVAKGNSLKPVKKRLYIKKKDKELPYSTCFELSAFIATDLNQNNGNELHQPEDVKVESPSIQADTPKKKLLIVDFSKEEECEESELSSCEDEKEEEEADTYYSVTNLEPNITRNSIWRRPIICASTTKKYKGISIPVQSKFKDYTEFKNRLKTLNTQQAKIETKARLIQRKLWEEDPNNPGYDDLLNEWLELVEEKDKLFYEENVLYAWIKDLKLQEKKQQLEEEIRKVSNERSMLNNPEQSNEEKLLIERLIETVNKRSELVDEIHEENMKRLEMINVRNKARNLSVINSPTTDTADTARIKEQGDVHSSSGKEKKSQSNMPLVPRKSSLSRSRFKFWKK